MVITEQVRAEVSRARLSPHEDHSSLLPPSPQHLGSEEHGETVWEGSLISENARLVATENPHIFPRFTNSQSLLTHLFVSQVHTQPHQIKLSPAFLISFQGGSWKVAVGSPDHGIRSPGSNFWLQLFLAADLGSLI